MGIEQSSIEIGAMLGWLLEEESGRLAEAVDRALSQIVRIDDWIRDARLSEDKRRILKEARAAYALELVDLIVSCRARGGRIVLEIPADAELGDASGGDSPPEDRTIAKEDTTTDKGPDVTDDIDDAAAVSQISDGELSSNSPDDRQRIEKGLNGWARGGVEMRQTDPARRLSSSIATEFETDLRALIVEFERERVPAEEMDFLSKLLSEKKRLRAFPEHVLAGVLQYAAARFRHMETVAPNMADLILQGTQAIANYAQETRCGFINGPARNARPEPGPTWEHDARAAIVRLYDLLYADIRGNVNEGALFGSIERLSREAAPFENIRPLLRYALLKKIPASHKRLVNLAAPFLDHMKKRAEFKALRNAIRQAGKGKEATKPEEPDGPKQSERPNEPDDGEIPSDWPGFSLTRGKRAVIIGGTRYETNRSKIQAKLEFSELVWENGARRSIQRVRGRVVGGTVDILIILTGFSSHDVTNVLAPACKDAEVPYVYIPHGHGIVAIQRGIETRISARPSA